MRMVMMAVIYCGNSDGSGEGDDCVGDDASGVYVGLLQFVCTVANADNAARAFAHDA